MRFGVTYMALVFNAVFTMEVFVLTKNLLVLLIALPIHGVCMLLCARDARYFDLLLVWAKTRLVAYFCHHPLLEGSELQPAHIRPANARRQAQGGRHGARRMKRATALRRELPTAVRIPYRAHVSRHVVRTESGDYVQVFKLAGASFESADDDVLNNWHERLNVLWRNIATANTALWVHIIRRREGSNLPLSPRSGGEGKGEGGFAGRLAAKYRERLSSETLMANELYLSVVYRPIAEPHPISCLASSANPQRRVIRASSRMRWTPARSWRKPSSLRSHATSPSDWRYTTGTDGIARLSWNSSASC